MGKRDEQQVTIALMALTDVRRALVDGERDIALRALNDAEGALQDVQHAPGIPVARAAEQLGLSRKTIEAWLTRGALQRIPDVTPVQVEIDSLQRAARALAELRERGQDRDWVKALADHLHDRDATRRPAVTQGLDQLRKGEIHPA